MSWVAKQHQCERDLPDVKEGRAGDIWRCDTCDRLWSIANSLWPELYGGPPTYWRRATRKQIAAHPAKEIR